MASWYGYTGPESPDEYLQKEIFPVLLPAMEEMLRVAMATERRKRFNSLDYMTAYLYRNNPRHRGRETVTLGEIPFVKEEWSINPRPPLPLSATLTEDEAATIIQSHYRGYLVRRQPKAQLFRTWQRKVQEERKAAEKIKTFMKKVSSTLAPNMSCDRRKSRQGPLLQEEGERGARENQGIPEESNMQDNSLLTTGEHI